MIRIALVTALAACTASPDTAPPAAISATALVSVDGTSLTAHLFLRNLSNPSSQDYIEGPDEHFSLQFRTAVMDIDPNGYTAAMPIDPPVAADEMITVTIDREGQMDELVGTVPPPFDLVLPVQGSASQPIDVTWSPTASDTMAWRGQGCTAQGLGAADGPIHRDTGMLEIPAGVLASGGLTGPCTVSFALDRTRTTLPQSTLYYASVAVTRSAHGDMTVNP